jgi:hypothetical protein
VLPFEDLSPDRSQHPFCEGMAAAAIYSELVARPQLAAVS